MFQSTHPHGVRLLIRQHRARRILFQSTHPHGVRPFSSRSGTAILTCFNPRTHTGCDAQMDVYILMIGLFQSTHPHGVRLGQNAQASLLSRFQSTHPHGVRPPESAKAIISKMFQSTHPHGVRHNIKPSRYLAVKSFNPRTHTGCDRGLPHRERRFRVSIHAPTRGATQYMAKTLSAMGFQSTHPHGVRLLSSNSLDVRDLFQSTHPHGVRRYPLGQRSRR